MPNQLRRRKRRSEGHGMARRRGTRRASRMAHRKTANLAVGTSSCGRRAVAAAGPEARARSTSLRTCSTRSSRPTNPTPSVARARTQMRPQSAISSGSSPAPPIARARERQTRPTTSTPRARPQTPSTEQPNLAAARKSTSRSEATTSRSISKARRNKLTTAAAREASATISNSINNELTSPSQLKT